jgi:arginase
VLDRGERPIVLGGDCSILLGTLLALRRRGRFGLLFLDGHADFYQPEANPNGEAASMELAFATGRGPALLADLEGRRPLVRDEDVVALGFRDAAEQASFGSQPLPPALKAFDLDAVRRLGADGAAREALAHLTRPDGPEGFWIHLDADVLDDAIMPAVDYRQPGGLSWDALGSLLRAAASSGRAVGLEVTIYNPRLDPDGAAARRLVDVIVDALA